MGNEKYLNASDIAHDVHRDLHHLGLTKGSSVEIVRGVFDAIKARLARHEKISIRKFGVFETKLHKGRTLHTPLVKGGSIDYADQYVIRFKQSHAAKREINEMAMATAEGKGKGKAKKAKAKKANDGKKVAVS